MYCKKCANLTTNITSSRNTYIKFDKNTKRIFRFINVFLVIAIIVTAITGCQFKSDEQLIEEKIDGFVGCYNAGDFDGVLECLDSKTQNTFKAALNITQGVLGINFELSDLFSLSVGLMSEGDILNIEIIQMTVNNDKATVQGKISYHDTMQSDLSDDVIISMIRENNKWVINDMTDN